MTASADLGTADLRALVNLIGEANDDEPGPAVPWALLDGLRALIPAVEVAFNQSDMQRHTFLVAQGFNDEGPFAEKTDLPPDHSWWTDYPRRLRQLWGGQPPDVLRWSARELLPQIRQWEFYEEFWPTTTDCMWMTVPGRLGEMRTLIFWREDGDAFSARDEALLMLLRPHVIEIEREARRRRDVPPELTAREWQVLELVAHGLSNAQIAHLLATSVSTVRKHLEHIYDRTGERSRGAALARMLPR